MYLCCLFDGVYITNKQLYYRKYCVKHRIKISEINALFVLDSVSLRRFGSVVYQIDKITGEQLKSVVLVKSIDNDMLNRYYNCRYFSQASPKSNNDEIISLKKIFNDSAMSSLKHSINC